MRVRQVFELKGNIQESNAMRTMLLSHLPKVVILPIINCYLHFQSYFLKTHWVLGFMALIYLHTKYNLSIRKSILCPWPRNFPLQEMFLFFVSCSWARSAHTWNLVVTHFRISGIFEILTQSAASRSILFSWSRSVHTCVLVMAALTNLMRFQDSYATRLMHSVMYFFIFMGTKCTCMRFSHRDIT